MKEKTYFYNFMSGEEAAASSRSVVEIRHTNYTNPNNTLRTIKKTIKAGEINRGKVVLSHREVMDCIFYYWNEDVCNFIERGNKYAVTILSAFHEFQNDNTFVRKRSDDDYVLGCMDVISKRNLRAGEQIEIFCQRDSPVIYFNVLRP